MAMTATYPEPGKIPAGIMALAVHGVFFALLVFGFSWKARPPETMMVEVWTSLPPAPSQPAPEPQPEVKPQPRPVEEPVKQEIKPEVKPDILLKEKAKKRRQEEERKVQQIAKAKQTEEIRQQQQQEALNRQLQAAQAAAQARTVEEYKGRIVSKIRRFIVMPPDVQGNPQAEFDVILLPSGDVLGVKLKKSSQHTAYDNAVERAIYKAQPLPLPPDPALFKEFRDLNLQFRPKE